MRKVCEVYLVSSASSDERGVELTFPVGQYEMMDAFEEPVERIMEAIHSVLERTPPELVADIWKPST